MSKGGRPPRIAWFGDSPSLSLSIFIHMLDFGFIDDQVVNENLITLLGCGSNAKEERGAGLSTSTFFLWDNGKYLVFTLAFAIPDSYETIQLVS